MRWRARFPRGQVLVFLLPLLAVLGAAAWWAFEAGQAVTEKQRLRDAAEAAALSGAVWQARSLNFAAAMNRAVIANEAVIAQSVSLRSWSDYMNRLLPTASALTAYVPYLNAATATLQAESSGASLATVLRAQADQRLHERFARAEKLALEAPVKMLGPLVLCIFPCTFLVLAFPLVMRFLGEG